MRDRREDVGLAIASVIACVIAVVIGVRDCKRREDCEARGGRVERYNYRTVYLPQSCGSGCTIIVPHEVSDWRCVGGRAEADE